MDEEYDVIVLGTGLTVSLSFSISCSDVSQIFRSYLLGCLVLPWMWFAAWASRSGIRGAVVRSLSALMRRHDEPAFSQISKSFVMVA